MINYNWIIETIEVNPEINGLTNVIVRVSWLFRGTNENNISGYVPGSSEFPAPDAESYIPYDQLTFETVCSWLESVNNMDDLRYKAHIAVSNNINPIYGTDIFPWS